MTDSNSKKTCNTVLVWTVGQTLCWLEMQAYLNDRHLCVVMEYADGGDMHAYMSEKRSLTEPKARWLFQQVPSLARSIIVSTGS